MQTGKITFNTLINEEDNYDHRDIVKQFNKDFDKKVNVSKGIVASEAKYRKILKTEKPKTVIGAENVKQFEDSRLSMDEEFSSSESDRDDSDDDESPQDWRTDYEIDSDADTEDY